MTSHHLARAVQPSSGPRCHRQSNLDCLLVRVGDGDRDALAAFYDELSDAVYGMSLSSGHGPALSAQITLDVFVQAWQQAGSYDPAAESAWAWVRSVAVAAITSRSSPARAPSSVTGGGDRRYSHA